MLKNHIVSVLHDNLGHQPTNGQESLMDVMADFLLRPDRPEVLLIKGYAGTGKTTLISALVKTLQEFRLKSVLMAPTGRAAKVLASYAGKTAFTIHKMIYRQKSIKDGFGKFVLDRNFHSRTIFMVDEASMISNETGEKSVFGSGRLLDDLFEYVYNHKQCKLIMIGDTAQLPPVKFDNSPALDKKVLEKYGVEVFEMFLSEIVRHSLGSGILVNATIVREHLGTGKNSFPKLNITGFDDISRISGEDLLEEITSAYDKFGIEQTMIVVRSNKMANRYNTGIRNHVLWQENEIATGDFLMVVKNNYYWLNPDDQIDFIANGDILEIRRILGFQERYGLRFADLILSFPDYRDHEIEAKVLMDTITLEAPAMSEEKNRELFNAVLEDYPEKKSRKQGFDQVRSDPFFNALQVKFSYAVTCHKAQGGQWPVVFVDQGYLNEEMLNIEYFRWLYTALTRATEKLFLVNFRDEFFSET